MLAMKGENIDTGVEEREWKWKERKMMIQCVHSGLARKRKTAGFGRKFKRKQTNKREKRNTNVPTKK